MKINKLWYFIFIVVIIIFTVGCNRKSLTSNNHTVRINKNSQSSDFYNKKDSISKSLGVNVDIILDQNVKQGHIKENNNVGIILSSLPTGCKYKIEISNKDKICLIDNKSEENSTNKRKVKQLFAFKALTSGTVTIKISTVNKDTKKIISTHTFKVNILN